MQGRILDSIWKQKKKIMGRKTDEIQIKSIVNSIDN